jgi:prephenate dehydrogenase
MTEVFINGLGLIGSSLARAIKQKDSQIKIVAADLNQHALEYAKKQKIIDEAVGSLRNAATADFIILATPVDQIIKSLHQLSKLSLKPGTIITDVGSTKQQIVAAAKTLPTQVTFISGHPMAGSHKTGVTAGRANLFENAFYFIVAPNASQVAIVKLQNLLQQLHVKWLELTPEQHDRLVGQISHLPHIIAAALVNQTQQAFINSPLGMRMAAGGFKSITRIAAADPTMWSAILQTNATIIADQLRAYQAELTKIRQAILVADQKTIYNFFASAKVSRDQLGPEKIGGLPGFYDLFINIPDRVGSIADVTRILAVKKINLVNLHILEIREEVDGILQLTFMNEKSRAAAKKILNEQHYQVITRK